MTQAMLQKALRILLQRRMISSQSDFGERLGYGRAFTSFILNGKKSIPGDAADKLASEFGFSTTWLQSGKGEPFGTDDVPAVEETVEGRMLQHAAKHHPIGVNGLIEKLGIPKSTLYYQFGQRRLSGQLKNNAAKALGISVQALFNPRP